jgi:hypothetical protein
MNTLNAWFSAMPKWQRIWTNVLLACAALGLMAPAAWADGSLRINDGVVVKFGQDAGLQVRNQIHTGVGVTFTSQLDDSAGGQTNPSPAAAAPGDWWGLFIAEQASSSPTAIVLNGLNLRFAGGGTGLPGNLQGGAALTLAGSGGHQFTGLQIAQNIAGVRIVGAGSPFFEHSQLIGNQIGLIAEQGATPRIESSDISGNADYGIQNLDPSTLVNAQGNWWGHASGPRDVANPAGQGDRVSAGVDYGNFLADLPGANQGPVVDLSFAGQPLAANDTITQPGQLSIRVQSPVGVARLQVSVDGVTILDQIHASPAEVTVSQFIDFAQLANGVHRFVVVATDGAGLDSTVDLLFTLNINVPNPPVLTMPVDNSTVTNAQVNVSGTVDSGATVVQIFVNGAAAGQPVTVGTSGTFGTTVALSGEGNHRISATASNVRGASAESAPITITLQAGVPSVSFVSPVEGATLSASPLIEISALDTVGIARIDLFADDQPIATITGSPWNAAWDISNVANGAYVLKAVATNMAGKTAEATRNVQVQKTIAPPTVPDALYVVRGVSITPAMSWGNTPIQITGEIVTNDAAAQPIPNANLRLILTVNGFERKINFVSDAQGQFAYTFTPSATDAGTYEVRIVHASDTAYAQRPTAGSFTINRLGAEYGQYVLNAIRGFATPATVRISASAGTGVTGVHWEALPADQPSGSLPPGITLDLGDPVDIAAGTTVPTSIKLTGNASAPVTGTIILKLFAHESGSQPRAELRLDYQLHDARPGLAAQPAALELGVQQNHQVSGNITLTNKGYTAALNTRVALFARGGGAAPDWVHLVSGSDIGDIDIGASTTVQITASPDAGVSDGYHQLELRISADNDSGGMVPVTIAVAQDGKAGVRFKIVDIYTNTLDAQGKNIEGLAGARIVLQNEALTNDLRSTNSNASGEASFSDIPPGTYRWRASAPNHMDASGRITIYAGLTASERVFMDYQLVSIEFSVTETTIRDVYNVVLEATYQTQVPAPVVLLEPMSINLPAMQAGEEITGELTLSNYGLVRADNLRYALPGSDASFRYEFFGELPKQLAAKSRVAIPYRITALQGIASGKQINMGPARQLEKLQGTNYEPTAQIQNAIRQFLQSAGGGGQSTTRQGAGNILQAGSQAAASCSSYQAQSCVAYDYDCAAGDTRSGSACASFSRVTGSNCSSGGGGGGSGSSGISGPGGGGWSGWGGPSSAAPQPLAPQCVPDGNDCSAGLGDGGNDPAPSLEAD